MVMKRHTVVKAMAEEKAAPRADPEVYRRFFEKSLDALFVLGDDGRIIEASKSATDLLLYSHRQMGRMLLKDLYAQGTDLEAAWRDLEQKGYIKDRQARLRKRDGTAIDCLVTMVADRTADGRVRQYDCMVRNVNEYERTLEALRESERRYSLLAESIMDVIWILDRDLHLTYLSPSVERLRGYSIEEVMVQRLDQILMPGSHAQGDGTDEGGAERQEEPQRPVQAGHRGPGDDLQGRRHGVD